MCNGMTRPQDAVGRFFPGGPLIDRSGNMPPLPGIFPDFRALIVRYGGDGRELVMARWGMPPSKSALAGKKSEPRRDQRPQRRVPSLAAMARTRVPLRRAVHEFRRHGLQPDASRPPVWFAFDETRPLASSPASGRALLGAEGPGGRDDERPLLLPDDGAERGGGARSSQVDAGDPDDHGRGRELAGRARGGGARAAAPAARRVAGDRGARREEDPGPQSAAPALD